MNDNIFQAIQEKYSVKEVAEQLGIRLHKVGGSLRANSIFGNGEGENAFAVYPESNRWHDFLGKKSGDITDLVAIVKFNGDKGAAIRYLMPEATPERIKIQFSQKAEFQKDVERWHNELMNAKTPQAVRALAYLHSRKISDATIKKLKIGIMTSGPKYRIVFPYFDESGQNVIYFTSRRYDWSGHGEDESEPKYMKASLQKYPFLRNSILGLNTLDRDNEEIIVTEGHMDWQVLEQIGYSVIAPNGGDFGKLMPQVMEKIKDFKKVILAFDGDEAGRGFTYNFARELIKEQIQFEVVVNDKVKDIAEFYQVYGAEKLKELIEEAWPGTYWCVDYIKPRTPMENMTIGEQKKIKNKCEKFISEISPFTKLNDLTDIKKLLEKDFDKDWISSTFKQAQKGMTEVEINDTIIANHQLLFNNKCDFYEYEDGIWKQKDDYYIGSYICKALGQFATGSKITSTLRHLKNRDEILSTIPLEMFNTLPVVTLQNGTLHIDMKLGTVLLKESSPTDYTTVKLPFRYDPNMKCSKWKKFMSEVTNGNGKAQRLLQEFTGYIFLPDCRFQKALMLKGGGSNGKSVFVNILAKLLGGSKGYVSYVEPSKLAKDFRLMPFKDSWLNISSDTDNDIIGSEGTIKKLIAGEDVEDAYKFKQAFSFPTRSKMIMCCNNYPRVSDTSEGFMRRFLIVEFPMHYVDADMIHNSNDRAIDVNLEQELIKELPGIFNWALEGLQRLLAQNGFTRTDNQSTLTNDFIKHNNHLMTFAKDEEKTFFEVKDTVKEGRVIEKRQVFRNYKRWSENNNEFAIGSAKFYAGLKAIFNRLGWEFTEKDGFWTFKDIKLAEPEYEKEEKDAGYIRDADEQMDDLASEE